VDVKFICRQGRQAAGRSTTSSPRSMTARDFECCAPTRAATRRQLSRLSTTSWPSCRSPSSTCKLIRVRVRPSFHWHLLDVGVDHVRIKPTPRRNGKVGRFHRVDSEESYRLPPGPSYRRHPSVHREAARVGGLQLPPAPTAPSAAQHPMSAFAKGPRPTVIGLCQLHIEARFTEIAEKSEPPSTRPSLGCGRTRGVSRAVPGLHAIESFNTPLAAGHADPRPLPNEQAALKCL
jgi:hypothetical protein